MISSVSLPSSPSCTQCHRLYCFLSISHQEEDVDSIETRDGSLIGRARDKHTFPEKFYYLVASLYTTLVEVALGKHRASLNREQGALRNEQAQANLGPEDVYLQAYVKLSV